MWKGNNYKDVAANKPFIWKMFIIEESSKISKKGRYMQMMRGSTTRTVVNSLAKIRRSRSKKMMMTTTTTMTMTTMMMSNNKKLFVTNSRD
jgi:hypothetical protein